MLLMRSKLLGAAFAAAALAPVACSSSSGGPTLQSSTPAPSGTSSGSASNSSNYDLDPAVASLRINADAASIDLTAADSLRAISVHEQKRGKATTKRDITRTAATMTAECPGGIGFGDECSVTYTVTMPSRVAVVIDGAAGDVTLTGPFNDVTVSTHAARVRGTLLGAGKYQVKTNAGTVNLTFSKPPDSVQVNTHIGAVTLTVPRTTKYAVTTDTTIGPKTVQVDEDPSSPHRLDISTTIGSITIKNG
jgi:hypothetical protein